MKFLADVNVPRPLIARLRAEGHEVLSVIDIDRRLKDTSILSLALTEGALILTNDKDYKRHVLEEKLEAHGVVWLRLSALPRALRADYAVQTIRLYQDRLLHQFTTIYPGRVEQQSLP